MTKSVAVSGGESEVPATVSWPEFRDQMPITREWAYFDHAAVSPLPAPSKRAIVEWSTEASEQGCTVWPQWAQRIERVRHQFAQLLNAHTTEIALVPNTTMGAHIVAEGFPWREGDRVAFLGDEFPSNAYPWLNLQSRGVCAEAIARPPQGWTTDAVMAGIDERTRLLALSWVGYGSGWRIDVESVVEAAHERGVKVFLDAIQGLGVFPLDVKAVPVDFLAADGHKWLLGPEGAGVLYIAGRNLSSLRPLIAGWHSVVHEHDFSRLEWVPKQSAERYEGGSQNMVGFIGLAASLELLAQAGAGPMNHRIADRLLDYTTWAVEQLRAVGAVVDVAEQRRHRSAIIPFRIPGLDPAEVRRVCLAERIVLSVRGGRLRISPHVYNNEDDLGRLVAVVQHLQRRGVTT